MSTICFYLCLSSELCFWPKQGCELCCYLLVIPSGDQLAIGKETGRRLGMGTNMYPSSALLGQDKDESIAALPVDELIEKADGFAGVFPGMIVY